MYGPYIFYVAESALISPTHQCASIKYKNLLLTKKPNKKERNLFDDAKFYCILNPKNKSKNCRTFFQDARSARVQKKIKNIKRKNTKNKGGTIKSMTVKKILFQI